MGNHYEYLAALIKPMWNLDEAISLISGEKPKDWGSQYDEFRDNTNGVERNVINKNTVTLIKAIQAIKNGDLLAYPIKSIPANTIAGVIIGWHDTFETEMYEVAPRVFIKWCIEIDYPVPPDLVQYFNYYYWTKMDTWLFDEAVMLIATKHAPFPHEIINSFESDQTHDIARKLRDAIDTSFFDDAIDALSTNYEPDLYIRDTLLSPIALLKWAISEGFELHEKLQEIYQNIAYLENLPNKDEEEIIALPHNNNPTSQPEKKCEMWLMELVLQKKQKPKFAKCGDSYWADAQEKFADISRNGFIRAWGKATTDYPEWNRAGKPASK